MRNPIKTIRESPLWIRVVPFLLFLVLTFFQGQFGEASKYWFYLIKTLLGVWMLVVMVPLVSEMRWRFSWSAVVAGIAVFALWVGLSGHYPTLNQLWDGGLSLVGLADEGPAETNEEKPGEVWNPNDFFGGGAFLAWVFIVVRILGSSLVVPPLEEVFYRSFLYRYLIKSEFEEIPLGQFRWVPFLLISLFFGLAHFQWLPGILCGMIYQGLVCWKKRLGDAMTAHAITNFLLGLWVVWKQDWQFW